MLHYRNTHMAVVEASYHSHQLVGAVLPTLPMLLLPLYANDSIKLEFIVL